MCLTIQKTDEICEHGPAGRWQPFYHVSYVDLGSKSIISVGDSKVLSAELLSIKPLMESEESCERRVSF